MNNLKREFESNDSSNEPLAAKIIAAASDGMVQVTPEKCEHIDRLITSHINKLLGEIEGKLDKLSDTPDLSWKRAALTAKEIVGRRKIQ